jgi:hypothetical protein
MNSPRDSVINIAHEVFKDNLLDIGFGGSCLRKENPSDWDVVLVLHDFYASKINDFIEKCKLPIGISVITDLQVEDWALWPSKVLVMMYKGMEWENGNWEIPSRKKIRKILRKNLPADIYRMERDLIDGKVSYEKAFNLLRQLALICR